MNEFTSCTHTMADGNIFSWLGSKPSWSKSYSLDTADFCKSKALGIKVLPYLLSFPESKKLCAQMHGQIYAYRSSLNGTSMDSNLTSTAFKDNHGFWCGYTDEKSADVFLSPDGKESLDTISGLQWQWGQPNGGNLENCTFLASAYTNLVMDKSCDAVAYVTCHFPSNPKFQFRGEHKMKLKPQEYFLLQMGEDLGPDEFHMKSSSGSVLERTKDNKWQLTKDTKVLATQNSSTFPVGIKFWRDATSGKELKLNLNACNEEQFSCNDGTCVSKWKRCDRHFDCNDASDEFGCKLLDFVPNYNKALPPNNSNGKTKVAILIKVDQVLDINISMETFKLKFILESTWKDPLAVFSNLRKDHPNSLQNEAWTLMWTPYYKFRNTENSLVTSSLIDEEVSIVSIILTDLNANDDRKDQLTRNFEYWGNQVNITKLNTYTIEFMCDLKWANYPFDIQTCPVEISMVTSPDIAIEYSVTTIWSASEVANYNIRQGDVNIDSIKDTTVIRFSLIFERDLKSILLTTYLPTFILTLINQLTNYFIGYEMFEAVVVINATTLLTLTSLFISTFGSLPQTTNIKLIDIWMLATFVYPFLIIIIHTLVHVNSRNQSKNAKKFERLLKIFGKVGLPIFFGAFTIVYFAHGARLLQNPTVE